MPLEPDVTQVIADLDDHFRRNNDAFAGVALDEERDAYAPWYARTLSSLALLVIGDQVVLAYASKKHDESEARMIIFTDRLVIVSAVDPTANNMAAPKVVGRPALKSMRVAASERADVTGSSSRGWPGTLRFTLEYEGLSAPVEFLAPGVDRYSLNETAPARTLLDSLRADLARGSAMA